MDFHSLLGDDEETQEKGKISLTSQPGKRTVRKIATPFSSSRWLRRTGFDWREEVLNQKINELEYLALIGNIDSLSDLVTLSDKDNVLSNISHEYGFLKIKRHHLRGQLEKPRNIDRLVWMPKDVRPIFAYLTDNLTGNKLKKELPVVVDNMHAFGVQWYQDLAYDGYPLDILSELELDGYKGNEEQLDAEIKKRVHPHYMVVGDESPTTASKLTKVTEQLKAICDKKRRDRTFNYDRIRDTRLVPQGFPESIEGYKELEGYFISTTTDRPPERQRAELRANLPDSHYLSRIANSLESMERKQDSNYTTLRNILRTR